MRDRTRRAGRAAFAAAAAAAFVGGFAATDQSRANAPTCTHGLSSIGPVYLKDGKITGDTTPHTEACLP